MDIELETKLDAILDLLRSHDRTLTALGELLIEASYVKKKRGLNKNTISQNKNLEKFQGIGQRKLLIKIEEVMVIKQRNPSRKRSK